MARPLSPPRPPAAARFGAWVLAASVVACAAPAYAQGAAEEPPPSKEHTLAFVRAVEGEQAATEQVKVVLTGKGTYFYSGVVQRTGKKVKVLTHLQREPDGGLKKYRRVEKRRQGPGVFAFRKGDGFRFVGLGKPRVEPVERASGPSVLVWDPAAWHGLEAWFGGLPDGGGALERRVLRVDTRTIVDATLTPLEPGTVGGKDGQAVAVERWKVEGLGDTMEVQVDGRGRLVSATQGGTTLMRQGWSSMPATPEAEEPAAAEEPPAPAEAAAVAAPGDGGTDGSGSPQPPPAKEEAGVGP